MCSVYSWLLFPCWRGSGTRQSISWRLLPTLGLLQWHQKYAWCELNPWRIPGRISATGCRLTTLLLSVEWISIFCLHIPTPGPSAFERTCLSPQCVCISVKQHVGPGQVCQLSTEDVASCLIVFWNHYNTESSAPFPPQIPANSLCWG